MSNEAQDYDIAAIRQLLLAAFTPEDLRRFCYDRPVFRPVVNRFGSKYNLEDMVDELITFCENYLVFSELLAQLAEHNPRQYARFLEPDQPPDGQALAAPEVLNITSPISLQLVRVPAGEFQMGSVVARDQDAKVNELPPHPVHVPKFHIGKYPVTNTQYQAFVQSTGYRAPHHWEEGKTPSGKSNHPVVYVSWQDALAFCAWLTQESGQPFRLPTEAEWEKAARGTDGRIYPWGADQPDVDRCNFANNLGNTTTIGRYFPRGDSPYGCADMAGNVWEWCQSPYKPYPYQADDGREVVQAEGDRVLRGGAFDSVEWLVRCAYRFGGSPVGRVNSIGFRVVVAPDTSDL